MQGTTANNSGNNLLGNMVSIIEAFLIIKHRRGDMVSNEVIWCAPFKSDASGISLSTIIIPVTSIIEDDGVVTKLNYDCVINFLALLTFKYFVLSFNPSVS